MTKKASAARPGGRSSRVKEAVFAVVETFLAQNPGDLPSMAAIAERAGVNPTSLYRRWGDARKLVAAVAVDRLMREMPVPDTGTLRGDLIGWATTAARSLSKGGTVSMLRVMAAAPATGGRTTDDGKGQPQRRSRRSSVTASRRSTTRSRGPFSPQRKLPALARRKCSKPRRVATPTASTSTQFFWRFRN